MPSFPLPNGARLTREFHVSLEARRRYGVDASLVDLRGRVMAVDPKSAERLATAMNQERDATRFPEAAVSGAEIVAAGVLDEAVHLMLDAYRRERAPDWTARLDASLRQRLGDERVRTARRAFVSAFPPRETMEGRTDVDAWLAGTVDDLPAGEVALEERIAVRLANENPALERFRELVDDRRLGEDDAAWADAMERRLAEMPGLPGMPGEDDLWSLLRAPMRASPTSLEGQLSYVRTHWGARLGARFEGLLTQLARSLDLLRELRAGGPAGPPGPAPVLDRTALSGGRDEPEAYSPDADWMPSVVLVAKNAYVWLEQLSRWGGTSVRRLDEVPDEALARLRERGFTGLWLIGLWERSEASARIKRMRGQEDAVASAYALFDYQIAGDLGGDEAWRTLRERAWRHGIRLAADMVPNHVGIDGRWVVEHPDRFLSLSEPPYPGYAFTGPDLSGDPRIEVRIEDGYWESRDAAVVFERVERATGERRYVYHGNDGTSMPWNDTAQIDYLNQEARDAVVEVILDVARKFSIIRFDAAMTLAKQHVQRLWYPPPGEGGAIPSRSAYGSLPNEAFERRMPVEFWREVVDRVAEEAPDTLLLAEAFWMMEGYFVRTLGMHRVYNSAFMNMLAREANDDYQKLMRNVLSFDPKILARFVNFMNNPDEETAIAQFGDGDKAYGVATLMATLPGLPMFGHGQVEGLREKYGMEYRRSKLDERPNEGMVARHLHEIAPLLRRRSEFAGTDRFRLLEVEDASGNALPDVFAYANGRPDGPTNLVMVHNRYAEAHGTVRRSVPFADGQGGTRRASLDEALGLRGGRDRFIRYRDVTEGLWYLARSDDWRDGGLPVRLEAYGRRVWVDIAEERDVDGRLERLHRHLGDRGVPDFGEAMVALRLAPVHEALASLVRPRAARVAPVSVGGATPGAAEEESGASGSDTGRSGESATVRTAFDDPDARDRSADPRDAAGVTDEAALLGFLRAVEEVAQNERIDLATLRRRWDRVPHESSAPGPAWRRAWAVASAFEHPSEAVRRLRLDVALAERVLGSEPDPFGIGPDGWALAWKALLPPRRPDDLTEPPASAGAAKDAETRTGSATRADATSHDTARAAERPSREGAVTRSSAASDEPPAPLTDAAERALEKLRGDDALQRLLGVHRHEGVAWFRREGFRAWLGAWAAVRQLRGESEARRAEHVAALEAAEARSGYRFDRLVSRGADATASARSGRSASAEQSGPRDRQGESASSDRPAEPSEGEET
jgi:glycosidase